METAACNWKTDFEGATYTMQRLLFRQPSEHRINGRQYPLEMQLVHKADWDDSTLIVSILFEEGASNEFLDKMNFGARSSTQILGGITPLGALNPLLLTDEPVVNHASADDELRHLRRLKCEKARLGATTSNLDIFGGSLPGIKKLADLMCSDRAVEATSALKYWTYQGSLTSPPCTEGVKWVVLQDVASLSPYQVIIPSPLPQNSSHS